MHPIARPRPALLLDRDGVINIDHGYVGNRARFEFTSGIFDLTRRAVDCGYTLVVVTNQSGIGRGYYSETDFRELSRWMESQFARQGAPLAGIFHCPYTLDSTSAAYRRDSFWRKPNPGMILEAARALSLNLARSVFLGDQRTDMAAATAAGVGHRVLIHPRQDHRSPARVIPSVTAATLVIERLETLTARLPLPHPPLT